MPARTVVLTAVVASCASSLVTLAVALLVLAPSLRAAPDSQMPFTVVRANRFEVVDSHGTLRVELGLYKAQSDEYGYEAAGLTLFDSRSPHTAAMSVSPTTSSLVLGRGPNRPSIMLRMLSSNAADADRVELDMTDQQRIHRLWLGTEGVVRPGYSGYIRDESGQLIWQAP
ncbi:MAG TPA: hypothetical protein VII06_08815 [Chloroflexota bacterium]|jgi:hypothetical protein